MIAAVPHLMPVHADKAALTQLSGYLGDIYHLLPARTERNAMRILEDQAIQLIIINAEPGVYPDGHQLCARLKSTPHLAHIPVVLLIPGQHPAARMASLEAGADAWVEKPLSRDYLRAQIRNLMANRARLKDHFSQSALSQVHPMASTGENEAFLNRLNGIISDRLRDMDLNVDVLARLMHMSRPTLYRKIKCISDLTPNELVNVVRLHKAAGLLSAADHKIFEIVKLVGFNSRSNFGKAFFKQYGVTPREYQQMTKSA